MLSQPTQTPDLFTCPFQSVLFLSNCPFQSHGDLWAPPGCLVVMILLSFRAHHYILAELCIECMSRLGLKVMSGMDPSLVIYNNLFMTTYIHIQQHLPDPSCTIHGGHKARAKLVSLLIKCNQQNNQSEIQFEGIKSDFLMVCELLSWPEPSRCGWHGTNRITFTRH